MPYSHWKQNPPRHETHQYSSLKSLFGMISTSKSGWGLQWMLAMISNLSHKCFNLEDQIKKEVLFFIKNPSINLFGAETYSRVSFHSY
ncbi:hypothetical protein ACB092_01G427600 [Castanea dentata]